MLLSMLSVAVVLVAGLGCLVGLVILYTSFQKTVQPRDESASDTSVRVFGTVVGLGLIGLSAGCGVWGTGYLRNWDKQSRQFAVERESWKGRLQPFAEIQYHAAGSSRVAVADQPAPAGDRIVIIDVTEAGKPVLARLHWALPDHVRARRPDEAGTVALITWTMTSVGRYTDGSAAVREDATLRLIIPRRGIVDVRQFQGAPPPSKKHAGSSSASGGRDDTCEDMRTYLLGVHGEPTRKRLFYGCG